MTLKTLTSPILFDHIKISFCEYKPLRKLFASSYVSFFMLTPKKLKTTSEMRNLHFYVPDKGTYMTK